MVFSAGDSNEWITQTDTQEDVSDKSRSEDAADHSIDLVDIDIDAGNSDDDIIIINNINNNDLQRKNDKTGEIGTCCGRHVRGRVIVRGRGRNTTTTGRIGRVVCDRP